MTTTTDPQVKRKKPLWRRLLKWLLILLLVLVVLAVAAGIYFLVGPDSSFFTGKVLWVDGGTFKLIRS